MRSLWEKLDVSWIWWWLAIYRGSLSMLAAYLASTVAAATAAAVRQSK
jgi:hypothetical protein